ncbi:MAG: HesA/MoeB/ThiF family protein, partial [Candidatus Heimdallarchaeaceae archaeon]
MIALIGKEEQKRYVRQIIMDNIGEEGQIKLKKSKVLVVGSGGLGSPVLYYLASAGIGTIGIIDGDEVEFSNLNRQIIHYEIDVGKPKTQSAKEKLSQMNSNIKIETYQTALKHDNAVDIISKYDFVIEASDNFETKFLVNDTCVALNKAFSIGGVIKFEGQMLTVIPGVSACYRCIFKEIPEPGSYPNACESGIMGTTAGFFGIIEANEAIKYILFMDKQKLLVDKILYCDLEYNSFELLEVRRDSN